MMAIPWIRKGSFFALFFCILPVTWSAPDADLILTNGKIITVDEAFSIHRAMAVQENRILAVGDSDLLDDFKGSDTQVIDLKGKSVLPGLIDSHAHSANASITEFDHELPEMDSIQDVLDYIRSRAEVLEDGEWIRVSQHFLTRLKEQRYPTKEELDQAAPNHPVIFRTGPDASVNTLALEKSGIDKDWEPDDGGPGFAETDPETGELTGILRNCTRFLKYKNPNKSPSKEDHLQWMKKLFADYNRVGLTSVGERSTSQSNIERYQELLERDELTIRAYISVYVGSNQPIEDIEEKLDNIVDQPFYEGESHLKVSAAKVFLDGGMLTGSAYMREPWGVSELYNISDPDYRGMRFIEHDHLVDIINACMERDIQFMAHSVGDGAVHGFIDACKELQDQHDIRQKRPVICHSNFMSEEAVRELSRLGICADIQPPWLYHDGRTLHHHFGYERLTWFQPLRSLFELGAHVGGGSDHMMKIGSLRAINTYDPWLSMYTAMTRKAKWLDRPLHPEQALSRVQAIRFYTINNAYLFFAEEERGSLEKGKLADFIVLDRDPITCSLEEFKNTKVLSTYIGGQLVYSKE